MKPTLVVLAAGMGSRYGGLKQVDPVGPSGEAILDYSVFDAVRGGFGKVVFVIRRDFEAEFREKVGSKYEGMVPVEYCFQDIADLPAPYSVPEGKLNVGYDYGLLLFNMLHYGIPGAERIYRRILAMRDGVGMYSETYIEGRPTGTRFRPWETAINISALLKFARTYYSE